MPEPTPFHPRTAELCTSLFWKDWAGYHAVRSYDTCHEVEYFALRHAAGLIDVTPLYKYDVSGPDAGRLLDRVLARGVARLKVGQVRYVCWCDEAGKIVDDGTCSRLGEEQFRLTANSPALAWLSRHARSAKVEIEDTSRRFAALALQGPCSRDVLTAVCGTDLAGLRFFRVAPARIAGVSGLVSRTGFTGDLGYELWVDAADALAVYDAVLEAGRAFRARPAGLDAMDVTRVEAGFVLHGVDYFSAPHCLIESRKSTPYELALGWTVELERPPFVGQRALAEEKARGPKRVLVGLVYDWDEYEALFAEFDLPPQVRSGAWRDPVPVYDTAGRQVGQATSGAWSPLLKRNLALATVDAAHGTLGQRLAIEVTAEYERRRVGATVVKTPFFDPERKRS